MIFYNLQPENTSRLTHIQQLCARAARLRADTHLASVRTRSGSGCIRRGDADFA